MDLVAVACLVSVDEDPYQMGAQVGHRQKVDGVDQFESMGFEQQVVVLQQECKTHSSKVFHY